MKKLKLAEKSYVEDWFDLWQIADIEKQDHAAAAEMSTVEPLRVYLKLGISGTLDKPEIIKVGLGSFQLDNQDEHCDDPVVISPDPGASHQEHVAIYIQRCTSLDGLTSQLDQVQFHMAPTTVRINYEFLAPLIEFAGSLSLASNSLFDGEAELCRQMQLISRFDELAATSTAKPTKIYAKNVELGSIKITATTKMQQFIEQMTAPSSARIPLLNVLIRLIATVGVKFVEIKEAAIEVDSLSLPMKGQDPFTTQGALIGSITTHVMHQALMIGLRVLGSTETFQGGTKLVGSVITGLGELGSGFRGLTDGDVVGVGVGVLGLGKNVAGGVLNAGNAVLGLAGDIAGTNAVTRNTVGLLIGGLQKGINEVSDAIDGSEVVSRNRYTRSFGPDDEMLRFSASRTLGTKLLHVLQNKLAIPAWVAENRCLASVIVIENDKSYATILTDMHVLQLAGPAHGHKRPTVDVLESLKLVRQGSTSLSTVQEVYLDANAVRVTRTHGCNYTHNQHTGAVEEKRVRVDKSDSTIKICAADASRLLQCFEALTLQLKKLHPSGAYREFRRPVLTASVLDAINLPKGRHAPGVTCVLQVPGAMRMRYTTAENAEDISPTFDEASLFVVRDYDELMNGQGVTLEIWDMNLLGNKLLGKAQLAHRTKQLNPLPSNAQFDQGVTWRTNGFETFALEDSRRNQVGLVRVKMDFQSHIWKWERQHSLKTGVKALLSQVGTQKSLKSLVAVSAQKACGNTVSDAELRTRNDSPTNLEQGSESADVMLEKSGWLYKHWSGTYLSTRKRWIVLAADGSLSWANDDKAEPKKIIPAGSFHSVKSRTNVKQVEFTCTHDDKHKDEVLVLEAEDAAQALEWKVVLETAVAKFTTSSGLAWTGGSREQQSIQTREASQSTEDPTPKDVPSRVVVTLWSGQDLPVADKTGASDPYVEIRVVSDCGGTKVKSTKHTSSVINDTIAPVWVPAEIFTWTDNLRATETATVRFKVWDRDAVGRDDLLGIAEMPLVNLLAEPEHKLKQDLELTDSHGKLLVRTTKHVGQARILVTVQAFYDEKDSADRALADAQLMAANVAKQTHVKGNSTLARTQSFSVSRESQLLRKASGIKVHLRVLRATNIPQVEMSMAATKAYVQLAFRDDRPQRTAVVHGNRSVDWFETEEEQHQFTVPVGAWNSHIRGTLWHRAAFPPDDLLGTFEFVVSQVQLEVSVITVKLTPGAGTQPMDAGEVPTVQLMCVRTEPSVYEEAVGVATSSGGGRDGESDEELAAAAALATGASRAGESMVESLRDAADEIATASAARAVADLCYQTSADGPLRRKAFAEAGGVEALVAILHVNAPTSVATKWVAEALRALIRENPKLASKVVRLDGLACLEAIVQAGKTHQTAAGLEAQKTLALLQVQVQNQQLEGGLD